MIKTFYHDTKLTTDELLLSMSTRTPLAAQDKIKEEIDSVREWAKYNAIAANAAVGTPSI